MSTSHMVPTHVVHYTATNLKPPHQPFTQSESQRIYTPDIINEYSPLTTPVGASARSYGYSPAGPIHLSASSPTYAQNPSPTHMPSSLPPTAVTTATPSYTGTSPIAHTSMSTGNYPARSNVTHSATANTTHSPIMASSSPMAVASHSPMVAASPSPLSAASPYPVGTTSHATSQPAVMTTSHSPAASAHAPPIATSSPMHSTTATSPAAKPGVSYYRSPSPVAYAPSDPLVATTNDNALSLPPNASIRNPVSPVPGTHYIPPMCEYVPPHKLQPGIQPSYSPYRVPVFVERPIFDLGRPTQQPKNKGAYRPSSSDSTSTSVSNREASPSSHQRHSPSHQHLSPSHSATRSPTHSHSIIKDRGVHESSSHQRPLASNIYVESEAEPLEPSLEWDYQKPRRRACC